MTTTDDREGEPLARDIMTTPVDHGAPRDDRQGPRRPVPRQAHRRASRWSATTSKLVGIVTEGDLMAMDADLQYPHYFELFDSIIYLGSQKKFKEQLQKAAAATVADLMTKEPHTVAPDDPARAAATLMSRHGFDRVPVDDDGKVVGIITRHDIMKILGL